MRTLATLLLCSALYAQDLGVKAPPQSKTIVITNATLHPVASEPVKATLVFHKGRITAVGGDAPGGATVTVTVIDGTGKHVYPGFIAPNSRLGIWEVGAVRATHDYDEVGDVTPEVRAAVAVNPDSTILPVTRLNGILLFAPFPTGGLIPGRASVMRMDGWTWEDMAVRADAGLVVRWPGRRRRWRFGPMPDNTPDRSKQQRRQLGEAFGKARAYHRARAASKDVPTDLRWEAMGPALRGERPVLFRAQTYDQIVGAVHFAAMHRLKAVVVGGRDAGQCTDLLKKHGVGVIVGGVNRFPARSDSDYDEVYGLPARLQKAGVTWCLSSGERTGNERNLPYAAARAAAYGLDKASALRAITLSTAEILGIAKDYGSLEKGKTATLFIADGDPLEVTTRIERAFIDGREITLESKQTVLAKKYREKYRQLRGG
ncbi:MAG: amidohydrolase family protein [Planctomycetota bacterium]|jgi:imidazolonepropionase-like amidohydrolase